MRLIHALFPTWGDVVAAGAWLLAIAVYLYVRLDDAGDLIDRILDDVFGSGR